MPATQSRTSALKDARQARNLTQRALADRVGVHRVTIAKVEAGTQTPSMRLALRLAAAVGQTVDELFGGDR